VKLKLFGLIAAVVAIFVVIGTFPAASSAEKVYAYVVDPYHAYSYEDMVEDANALQSMYPELIRLGSIGKSVEGRDLMLVEFGHGNRKIFLNGAVHAREYISSTYLMYMIDRYAYAHATGSLWEGYNLKDILSAVTFCIVPMVNPDGVNLVQNGIDSVKDQEKVAKIPFYPAEITTYSLWKANINGVDLNRNYPLNWLVRTPVKGPASSQFKGYIPLSEPESQAVANYLNSSMCWAFISFHTSGEGLYGWDDGNAGFYPQLHSMVTRIIASSGFKKLVDTAETSYGTFAGYVRKTYLKPTLTVELCKYIKVHPYPDEDFDSVWKPAKNICLIVGEEVMKMEEQAYQVYQNDTFLHAFYDERYALAFAKKWANSKVIYVESTADTD